METKTPSKLEALIPSKDIIISGPNGYETVYDTNGYLRDQIRDLFRQTVLESIEDAPSNQAAAILETLRIKIGEL